MKTKQLFAFWRYDKFPYVLGGEVVRVHSTGSVETKGYGPGFLFTPLRLLPLSEGRKIDKELRALEQEYRKELDSLHDKFKKKRDGIIKV